MSAISFQNKREFIRARKELYWGILRGNLGKDIVFSEFVGAGKTIYGDDVGESGCQNTFKEMKSEPCPLPGGVLTVGKLSARLDRSETVLEYREKENPEAKESIGRVVWKLLFTDAVISDDQLAPTNGQNIQGRGFSCWLTHPVKEKVLALRHQPLVTVLFDAGSTVRAVAREFGHLSEVPLRVQVGTKGNVRDSLVRFNFISNSVKIIEQLSNSTHRKEIGLTIIGGDVRTDRLSVCGLSSQVFLDECIGGGDVAVIGTTGYGGSENGRSSFFCDNLEEARLKTSLLDRVSLRTLVIDSSKLAGDRPVTRAFADLSSGCIDLIFVDDGKSIERNGKDQSTLVDKFRERAVGLGVSVAVAQSERSESASANGNNH